MSDEQYREFHLAGKQLVFLFISSTVVAVVIFLCGVMVGRGVPASRAEEPVEFSAAAAAEPLDPSESSQPQDTPLPESAPAPLPNEFSYPERLENPSPVPDTLPTPKPAVRETPEAAPPRASTTTTRPAKREYAVQVMAVTKRAEADATRKRLMSKGYPAFVAAADGRFRVRVGPYGDRKAAVAIKDRLQKQEKFSTAWVDTF